MAVRLWPADASRAPTRSRRRTRHRHGRRGHARVDRPGPPRRPRQRLLRQPAVRDADGRRPVAGRPTGARRVVDDRRGRKPGDLHPARRPHVQRRHAAHGRRRGPQLAPAVQPGNPSPLASLIADIVGARDLLSGASTDPSTLGVHADGDRTVVVDLERGGGSLPTIVSSAPFAIVPRTVDDGEITPDPGKLVGSGGYTLERVDRTPWTSRRTRATGRANPPSKRPDADHPQWAEPGRRVRRRRRRRGADRVRGRGLDRVQPRRSGRPSAATPRCRSCTTGSTREPPFDDPRSARPSPRPSTGSGSPPSTSPARPNRLLLK